MLTIAFGRSEEGTDEQDELMARSDVTAAFILTSSVAILASAQELSGHTSLLPPGTTHLAGHGFIGTLTSLVASSQLDLPTAVRLAVSPHHHRKCRILIDSVYTHPSPQPLQEWNQKHSQQPSYQLDNSIHWLHHPMKFRYQMKNRITVVKGQCN